MRLICPNCGAQYEVPADVIPDAGRDVQCSNCGDTWFQPHPDQDIGLAEELERALPDQEWQPDEPEPEADTQADNFEDPMPQDIDAQASHDPLYGDPQDGDGEPELRAATRRELDPAIADLLREEASHEARAREAESIGLESQPDLGLEEPETETDRRARESRNRMSRLRGQPVNHEVETVEIDPGTRRGVLPDIEEINSTLRSTGDRKAAAASGGAPAAPLRRRRGRGFRLGFGLTLLIAAGAIMVYVNAGRVVELIPEAKPAVTTYVGKVEEARIWLDTQMVDVMLWLDEKAAAAGGNTSDFGDLTPPQTSDNN